MMNIPVEDNTMVLKLMGEFESSLADKFERNRKDQLGREQQCSRFVDSSRIARLENELQLLKSAKKRARVEEELEEEKMKKSSEHDKEALEEMKKQYADLLHQLEQQKLATRESKAAKETIRKQYEEQLKDLRQKKLKVETTLQDLQISSRSRISNLTNDITRKESEKQLLKTEVAELQDELKRQRRRGVDSGANRRVIEEYKVELNQAKQRTKELESQLREQQDTYAIARAVQNDATRLRELEQKNEELEKENEYFRETIDNNQLLKEQVASLETKLKRFDQRMEEIGKLQVENEELKEKLKRWETVDKSLMDGSSGSPSSVVRRLAELQQSQVEMLARQGEVMTSSRVHEQAYTALKEKLRITTDNMLQFQEKNKGQEDFIRKIKRKLIHLTKERDVMRDLIDSYDSEITNTSVDLQLKKRIDMAEKNALYYQKEMETLETENNAAEEDKNNARIKVLQLESRMEHLLEELSVLRKVNASLSQPPSIGASTNQEEVDELKKKVSELEQERDKLQERNEYLELYKEQRNMKGDFDPSKTKVLSFSMNPASMVRAKREKDQMALEEECQALRERVQVLEEVVGDDGNTKEIAAQIKLRNDKEFEALKKDLEGSQLREQRLKEVFKKKIHELREACYRLTGYNIHNPSDNHYRLQSMYAESAEDVLEFRSTSDGSMQLLQNDFSSTLQDFIDMHLKQQDSIPAFLSSVTLDLFSRQTMTNTLVIN